MKRVRIVKRADAFYVQFCWNIINLVKKECRDVPWNVSIKVLGDAYLIYGDVY
jgi:hypothetical protein